VSPKQVPCKKSRTKTMCKVHGRPHRQRTRACCNTNTQNVLLLLMGRSCAHARACTHVHTHTHTWRRLVRRSTSPVIVASSASWSDLRSSTCAAAPGCPFPKTRGRLGFLSPALAACGELGGRDEWSDDGEGVCCNATSALENSVAVGEEASTTPTGEP
jgi:hypothetical protein